MADLITKAYINSTFMIHESFVVIKGLFNITHVRNPGAAFGFLATLSPSFRALFFITITIIVIFLVLYYISKSHEGEMNTVFALSLILSGAVGNLIDRVRFGEVIDFIDIYIGNSHWPAFNVADAAISTGAVIMMLELFKRKKQPDSSENGKSQS